MKLGWLAVIAASATLLLGAASAQPALEVPGFFVGFSDDLPRAIGPAAVEPAQELGAEAFRFTLQWEPGQTRVADRDIDDLQEALQDTAGMKVVLAVYSNTGSWAPKTEATARRVLRVRRGRAHSPSVHPRRGDLERAEQALLLVAAAGRGRRGRRAGRLRGVARALLRRPPRRVSRRERHRPGALVDRQRRRRIALTRRLHPRRRRRLPGQRTRSAAPRHRRPPRLRLHRRRATLAQAHRFEGPRAGRLEQAHVQPLARLPRHRASDPGRRRRGHLVHGGRLADGDRRRQGSRVRRAPRTWP